jgi:hypothetical protein
LKETSAGEDTGVFVEMAGAMVPPEVTLRWTGITGVLRSGFEAGAKLESLESRRVGSDSDFQVRTSRVTNPVARAQRRQAFFMSR